MLPSLGRGWRWNADSRMLNLEHSDKQSHQCVEEPLGENSIMWELRDVAPAMNEDLEGDKLPEQIPLACVFHPGLCI